MADEIAVREMRLEDIDGIMEIEHGSFATPWTKQDLIGELSNTAARYFVALEGEKVVAYAGTWLIIDEGHITNVAVHPDWRGRGCGTRVLYALIQADGSDDVKVETEKEPAFDFRPVGYGKQNIPAIIAAGLESGASWFIVEQDRSSERPALDAAKMSCDYVRSL